MAPLFPCGPQPRARSAAVAVFQRPVCGCPRVCADVRARSGFSPDWCGFSPDWSCLSRFHATKGAVLMYLRTKGADIRCQTGYPHGAESEPDLRTVADIRTPWCPHRADLRARGGPVCGPPQPWRVAPECGVEGPCGDPLRGAPAPAARVDGVRGEGPLRARAEIRSAAVRPRGERVDGVRGEGGSVVNLGCAAPCGGCGDQTKNSMTCFGFLRFSTVP